LKTLLERKKKKIITSKETKAKVLTTGKEPKKESAMIAPATGKRLLQARTTLYIFVAAILFTLNSVIKNTIRFAAHPPAAMDKPITLPAQNSAFTHVAI
jgi:hypothetical protein